MHHGLLYLVVALIALDVGYLLFRGWHIYSRLRGERLVTCPETQKAAAVDYDTKHLVKEVLFGTPSVRLGECSRWPERQGCGQECLQQIEVSSEGCLVRGIVTQF